MFDVRKTPTFDKVVAKTLSNDEATQLEKIILRLRYNPWLGDGLHPPWLREVKLGSKRVYFVVGDIILLVGVSNKNSQKAAIKELRTFLRDYARAAGRTI